MDFDTCGMCGSIGSWNYCWHHRAPRFCQGLYITHHRQGPHGHLQSPLCLFCYQRPALISCCTENTVFCYPCFTSAGSCVVQRHALHVLQFVSHTACRAFNSPLMLPAGRGRDGAAGRERDGAAGRGRGGAGQGRDRQDLQLRLGSGGGVEQAEEQCSFYVRNLGGELIFRLSMIGIDSKTYQPTQIQTMMIASCLSEIERKTTGKKRISVLELNKSTGEALMAMMDSAKESLKRILVQGDFSEYLVDQHMHCSDRLADMLSRFSVDLQAHQNVTEFLMDEIQVLRKCECVVVPRSAFLAVLSRYVDGIHTKPVDFIRDIWDYIGEVFLAVITSYSDPFPEIQGSIKQAGEKLISKLKEQSEKQVIKILEMEKLSDYTCNPEYMKKNWSQKTSDQERFIHAVLHDTDEYFQLDGFGNVKISHLRKYQGHLLEQAFTMKMRITSYWPIVLQRIVDNLGMHLQLSVKYLVNSQFKSDIVSEMLAPRGGSLELLSLTL